MTSDFENKARQKKTITSSFCFAGLVSLSFSICNSRATLVYIYMDEHTAEGLGIFLPRKGGRSTPSRGGNLIDPVTEWPQQHFHLLVYFFVQMVSLSLPSCVLSLPHIAGSSLIPQLCTFYSNWPSINIYID